MGEVSAQMGFTPDEAVTNDILEQVKAFKAEGAEGSAAVLRALLGALDKQWDKLEASTDDSDAAKMAAKLKAAGLPDHVADAIASDLLKSLPNDATVDDVDVELLESDSKDDGREVSGMLKVTDVRDKD